MAPPRKSHVLGQNTEDLPRGSWVNPFARDILSEKLPSPHARSEVKGPPSDTPPYTEGGGPLANLAEMPDLVEMAETFSETGSTGSQGGYVAGAEQDDQPPILFVCEDLKEKRKNRKHPTARPQRKQ